MDVLASGVIDIYGGVFSGLPGAFLIDPGHDFDTDRAKDFYKEPSPPPVPADAPYTAPNTPPPDPEPEPTTPPEPPMYSSVPFTLFAVGNADSGSVGLAQYPYIRTPNGNPLFSFTANFSGEGTTFIVADNKNEYTVSVPEHLFGIFCVLLKWEQRLMSVETWCKGSSNPIASNTNSGENVSFTPSQIIAGW